MTARREGDLQDGLLAHYLQQVKMSDVNVEARIEKEPFDFRKKPFREFPVGTVRAHRRKLVNP